MKSLQDYIFEKSELNDILYSGNIYEWTNYNSTGYKIKKSIKKGIKKFWNWLWGSKKDMDDIDFDNGEIYGDVWNNLGTITNYFQRIEKLNEKNIAQYIESEPYIFPKNANTLFSLIEKILKADGSYFKQTNEIFNKENILSHNIPQNNIKGIFKFINEEDSKPVVIGFAIYILPCKELSELLGGTSDYNDYLHIRYIETIGATWNKFVPGILTSLVNFCINLIKSKNIKGITINNYDKDLCENLNKAYKNTSNKFIEENNNLLVLKNN